MNYQVFIDRVWEMGQAHYRDLPWRHIDDPYAVLVSEVMLQQTQVKRVLDYWPRWMRMFPTIDALASASTSDVLEMWQGLGYNRRALAIKRCADECSEHNAGQLPGTVGELVKLPGIGPATAAGVVAFAFNKPAMYLETNVRSVFLHELFPGQEGITDKQLTPLVQQLCCQDRPRDWYYALLDYGAYLKSQGVNPSRRSAHYSKQSKFEGSHRQKRANLLRVVLDNPGITVQAAHIQLDQVEQKEGRPLVCDDEFDCLLNQLASEGFFTIVDDRLGA